MSRALSARASTVVSGPLDGFVRAVVRAVAALIADVREPRLAAGAMVEVRVEGIG
jgi:hypothetical protein